MFSFSLHAWHSRWSVKVNVVMDKEKEEIKNERNERRERETTSETFAET